MSGSLLEENPFGQGNTRRSRAGRAPYDGRASAIALTEWRPHDYQLPLLAVDRGIVLANGALGAGKSEPGAELLLRWALRYPRRKDGRPTKWYVIGPDFSLIKQEQFGKLLEHLRKITVPGYASLVKRVVGGQDPRIILLHDQVILGRSATDPDRLRGHEIDGFWGDEVQKWPEKAFRIALSRLRSASATRAVLTGSPEDAPGWIWRLISGEDKRYNRLRERLAAEGPGSGFYCARWRSDQNKANEAGVLGTIGAGLEASAEGASAQELEGRFPGTPESPSLGVIDHSRAFVGAIALAGDAARPSTLGVDVGETDDFTWLTVLSARGVVLHMERWNAGSPNVPRATFYPYLESRVEALAKKWRVLRVVVDEGKAGKPIRQSLAQKLGSSGISVLGLDTSVARRKQEAIEALALALARGDVRIPSRWKGTDGVEHEVAEVGQLRKELDELVPVSRGEGKRSWDHPRGGHDDGVVSLAVAFYGLPGMGRGPEPGNYSGWRQPPFRRTFRGR